MKVPYEKRYEKEEKKPKKLPNVNVKQGESFTHQWLTEMFEGGVFKEKNLEGRGLLFSDIEKILKEAVKATQKEDLEKFNKKTDSLQKHVKDLKSEIEEKQVEISKLNTYVDKLRDRYESKDDFLNGFLAQYMNDVKELRSEIVSMINNGRTISVAEIDRLSKPLLDRPSIEDNKVFIDPADARTDLDPHIEINIDKFVDGGIARDINKDLNKLRSLVGKNKIIKKEGD